MNNASGSCLCKAVTFSFEVKAKHFDACHCAMCRNWGGGPALSVEASGKINIKGLENVTVFDSSEWAERGFCKHCGTHIFYRFKDPSVSLCYFHFGTLDNQEEFEFTHQIYIDKKPDNYAFANDTKMLTEQDVLTMFGAQDK
jgi:hypothetical protein